MSSVSKDKSVEIELEDVLDFIEFCDNDEAFKIVQAIEDNPDLNIVPIKDPIYEEVLSSDSWESRDKIAFLKTIFEKTSLEEFKNKLL